MNKPDFYWASDYAGLSFNGGDFYYGYEYSICKECGNKCTSETCDEHENAGRDWCFTAAMPGKRELIVIPFSKLETKDMFDVVTNLNMGIGWILSKYNMEMNNMTNSNESTEVESATEIASPVECLVMCNY